SLRSQDGRRRHLGDLIRDLRLAFRALARQPLFSGVMVLVLALGIGASTAIFTLVDAVVLSPLPFDDADRLVALRYTGPGLGMENVNQCAAWHFTYEDENRVFEDLGMYGGGTSAVTGEEAPEAVPVLGVTSGVFRALRVHPVVGRSFTPEDEEPGAPAVVLLSHRYWQARFGGDPGVVGRMLRIDGQASEIVGVMPPSLRSLGPNPALILPLRFRRSQLFVGNMGARAVARLRDGVTIEQASADIARMLPLAFEKFPGGPTIEAMRKARFAPDLRPLKDSLVGSVANLLWILMAGVSVVLLIACANAANLFLVRAEGKESEMAIRTAMGASTGIIGWEYLKESLLLGVLGGVGGLGLAYAGLRVLVALGPSRLPRLEEVSLNPQVLLFTLGLSLGAGLVFGIFPVLRHRRRGLVEVLKPGTSRGMSGGQRHRTQKALAVSQMALALLLLVASVLMIRSFQALRNVDPGFGKPEEVLALRLTISPSEVSAPDEVAQIHETVARRLAEIPGVTSVGLGMDLPMDGFWNWNPLYAEGITSLGSEPPAGRRHKWIGEGYFETLQIPLLSGRTFTWHDVHNRIPAVLVSENLAREYWGSAEAALGKRVALRPAPVRWHEVIGVVGDVREDGVDQETILEVYWPQVTLATWEGTTEDDIETWRTMAYAIRSSRVGSPDFLREVREAIWSVNPNLPLQGVLPLTELMARSVARTSFALVLLGIAAGVALILGIIGVYGVISYAVSRKSRELALRMALGARAGHVKGMVLRQGLVLSGIGVLIGLGLAFGLTRLMAGLLFGVSPVDPVTFLSVAAGLSGVALAASYLPARRAARVDPMTVLRAE
ncbi:MAG: ABC transporter permease, partial [bacterium]|nr:ABC transporter permease [bacterium]